MAGKSLTLAIIAVICGLGLLACDDFVSYTVVNQSDDVVRTGYFNRPCSPEAEARLRKGPLERRIEPGASLHVGGVPAGKPECVVIKSDDESIVALRPYADGVTYVVTDSQAPAGFEVLVYPEAASQVRGGGGGIGLAEALVIAIAGAGALSAGVIAFRYFYRYYISKTMA